MYPTAYRILIGETAYEDQHIPDMPDWRKASRWRDWDGDPTITPIARLPSDILYDIFYLIASSVHETAGEGIRFPVVAHVCHDWRSLVFSSPQLWSFVVVTPRPSSAILQEYLTRSSPAPIRVKIISFGHLLTPAEFLEWKTGMLKDVSDRIEEFYAVDLSPKEMLAVLGALKAPAPVLRRLTLRTDRRIFQDTRIFRGEMVSLQHVSMKRVAMPWCLYRDLTMLELDNQPAPALNQLLWTLRNSPALRVLRLGIYGTLQASTAFHEDTQSIEERIDLPRLEILGLVTHVYEDVPRLLSYLSWPSMSTAVTLTLRGSRTASIRLDNQCPTLQELAAAARNMTLELSSDSLWASCISLTSSNPFFRVQWDLFEHEPGPRDLTHVGLTALSYTSVEHLSIRAAGFRATEAQWVDVLSHLHHLTSADLDFRDSRVMEFFDALTRAPVGGADTDGLVCPYLRRLVVTRLDDSLETLLNHMVRALRARFDKGSKLAYFEIVMRSGRHFPLGPLTHLHSCADKVNVRYLSMGSSH